MKELLKGIYNLENGLEHSSENSATKFEFDSFKICDRSRINKIIIRYNISSLSVNASSPATSVKLVIIWGNMEEKGLKPWTVVFLQLLSKKNHIDSICLSTVIVH